MIYTLIGVRASSALKRRSDTQGSEMTKKLTNFNLRYGAGIVQLAQHFSETYSVRPVRAHIDQKPCY